MGFSKLEIWNMALAALPESHVDTIDERSLGAEACAREYPNALELLLEDHDYDFAVVRAPLAQVVNDRAAEWPFAYALPEDMARPRHLLPYSAGDAPVTAAYSWVGRLRGGEHRVPFRMAGDRIYCRIESATLEYVSKSPGEARFSAMFARALALELATRIVMPIKKDSKRQGELIRLAETARDRAKASDMNRDQESPRDFIPDSQLARMGLI